MIHIATIPSSDSTVNGYLSVPVVDYGTLYANFPDCLLQNAKIRYVLQRYDKIVPDPELSHNQNFHINISKIFVDLDLKLTQLYVRVDPNPGSRHNHSESHKTDTAF